MEKSFAPSGAEKNDSKSLLKKMKSVGKKTVATGMALAALSGAGCFEKKSEGKESAEKDSLVLSQKNENVEEAASIEELRRIYQHARNMFDDYGSTMVERKKTEGDPGELAEKIKRDLMRHIESEAYFEKLKIEFSGDVDRARIVQDNRLLYLRTVKTIFCNKKDFAVRHFLPFLPANPGFTLPDWLFEVIHRNFSVMEGCFLYRGQMGHEVLLSKEELIEETCFHEYLHASTLGSLGISERARKILEEAYNELGNEKWDEYFRNSTERLARKQQLDLELEMLEVKKYEEKFTESHFRVMMDFYARGFFSWPANSFIKTTKPEYFEQIFNEIALNDIGEYAKSVENA